MRGNRGIRALEEKMEEREFDEPPSDPTSIASAKPGQYLTGQELLISTPPLASQAFIIFR